MEAKKRFKTVDEYNRSFPENIKGKLEKIRKAINETAPDAKEVISYNMPAYKFHGILLYYAAHTEHIGIYAMPSVNVAFKKELSSYGTSKGGIRFPFNKPIPTDLIKKIVKYRIKENMMKEKKKIGKK